MKFDEPAIVEALRRGCRYVGAVGSKKTQGDRRARLREAGVTDDELARLRGPVGLDLGGRNPSETALAIIAEVVAERYGGSGTPLVDKSEPPNQWRPRDAGLARAAIAGPPRSCVSAGWCSRRAPGRGSAATSSARRSTAGRSSAT